jgi:Protein of unknown function (DUF4232)
MTPSGTAGRRLAAGAALTGMAALVTACGASGSGTAAPTATVTVTGTPTPTATAPAGAGSGTATAPATPAGPAACPTRALQVKRGIGQGTAGSIYTVLDFVNISGAACTLYGYPGVSFVTTGAGGGQIGAAATESTATARKLVTLGPGATANALLRIVDAGNFPPSRCHSVTAHWLQIYPPNQTTPTYLPYTSQTCSKPVDILSVSVVQAGSGSS